MDLVSRLLEYTPSARLSPLLACAHTFFDELRQPECKLPNGKPLPPIFNFSEEELRIEPNLNSILVPQNAQGNKFRNIFCLFCYLAFFYTQLLKFKPFRGFKFGQGIHEIILVVNCCSFHFEVVVFELRCFFFL